MSRPEHSSLGLPVDYPTRVDAGLLFPIERERQRRELFAESQPLPFHGADLWTAWELSWLDRRGRPRVAVARIEVPAGSPAICESKSLKLYLNGYAHERFDDADEVRVRIETDLIAVCGAPVRVELVVGDAIESLQVAALPGRSLDGLEIDIAPAVGPDADLLGVLQGVAEVDDALVTRLFRSRCPVTGQPDWADVLVAWRGAAMDPAGLLRYLVSFREHQGFHEQCVERIFRDVLARCRPVALTVLACFTRRGGIDIAPWRSNDPRHLRLPFARCPRA
ncbi:MAG: NADPH-dependent 7-cyano-7-deazaguanine reductase QueF [Xanthomonadales bacterium]|nr:NADPH-dependent 7-cyano-7-deazaguanine reductase QueF [Xanthomonadales bacterium]